jgi:hypothetical protein
MDDLSPAFAAESLTTVNIIEELRELESTDDYTKQLGLITEMEEKYNLEEGILLSHCKYLIPPTGNNSCDQITTFLHFLHQVDIRNKECASDY